MIPLKFE
ncbi:hypothetical protein YPPY99_4812, partial [Yersinia pestis PY-99]